MKRLLAAAALSGLFLSQAHASDNKTWYVYCEGHGHGMHWAVFSQNIWQDPGNDTYGRSVGSRAEEFFEAKHDVPLTGCSGVEFFDVATARYSRDRTVKLHKKMGDRVYFFNLPTTVLP
ncbi:MAG: hypothetical protein AAGJ28_11405 [Pseudomonadota bacterium]